MRPPGSGWLHSASRKVRWVLRATPGEVESDQRVQRLVAPIRSGSTGRPGSGESVAQVGEIHLGLMPRLTGSSPPRLPCVPGEGQALPSPPGLSTIIKARAETTAVQFLPCSTTRFRPSQDPPSTSMSGRTRCGTSWRVNSDSRPANRSSRHRWVLSYLSPVVHRTVFRLTGSPRPIPGDVRAPAGMERFFEELDRHSSREFTPGGLSFNCGTGIHEGGRATALRVRPNLTEPCFRL